ncbi:hypothetical protein A3E49_01590 [Candidatus Saccharibacteria bacterium RIFCSPHIGHO2_12_FULL_49_19]|nr:MAG: hypothetical protein A3E49_01590 [Candidatus Saccharibacteria bacterium RIFCSPHIGHO2_12_FULL_49_19]
MSKKLILVLAIIGVLMFGAASLVKPDSNSKEKPAEVQLSLNDMVGKPAPDFSLQNQRGETFKLSAMSGKKTILFFNEGIMCYPACWNQMAALGKDVRLNNDTVVSASVVVDSPANWASAFKKMPELSSGTILFDSDKSLSTGYGMLSLASSMHKGSMPGHTYIIVDENRIVRYTLDDPKMSIQNEVLVNELSKI